VGLVLRGERCDGRIGPGSIRYGSCHCISRRNSVRSGSGARR
jgi:hypothetical protein